MAGPVSLNMHGMFAWFCHPHEMQQQMQYIWTLVFRPCPLMHVLMQYRLPVVTLALLTHALMYAQMQQRMRLHAPTPPQASPYITPLAFHQPASRAFQPWSGSTAHSDPSRGILPTPRLPLGSFSIPLGTIPSSSVQGNRLGVLPPRQSLGANGEVGGVAVVGRGLVGPGKSRAFSVVLSGLPGSSGIGTLPN